MISSCNRSWRPSMNCLKSSSIERFSYHKERFTKFGQIHPGSRHACCLAYINELCVSFVCTYSAYVRVRVHMRTAACGTVQTLTSSFRLHYNVIFWTDDLKIILTDVSYYSTTRGVHSRGCVEQAGSGGMPVSVNKNRTINTPAGACICGACWARASSCRDLTC